MLSKNVIGQDVDPNEQDLLFPITPGLGGCRVICILAWICGDSLARTDILPAPGAVAWGGLTWFMVEHAHQVQASHSDFPWLGVALGLCALQSEGVTIAGSPAATFPTTLSC